MSTGKAEVRGEPGACVISEGITLVVIFTIVTVSVAFGAVLHTTVHNTNTCSMTYMYRRLQFLEIPMPYPPSTKYSLSVYNEGYRWWNRSYIEAGQIPVLFIPGSQGSAKQARSLASLMQNKTESRRAPFSFRFFAVDFDEEMTFLNGNVVNRQLDYVMHAIKMIQSMMRVKRKVVIVGHSYGGLIGLLASIHPDFRQEIELIITKGAPLNKQPVLTDWLTMRLTMFLANQWEKLQSSEMKHVGVVAYSGGLRDYLIPDEWSIMKNVTNRPLWAIDGVSDLGVDHLAVLWCNEFVRHVSRVLWSYAEHLEEGWTGRQVVEHFYKEETERNVKRAHLLRHISEVPWKEIKVGERHVGLDLASKQVVLLLKPERYEVFSVRVNASCVKSMTTVRYDESMMHFKNATDGVVEAWIYRALANEKVRLLVDVELPCKIDVQTSNSISVHIWRFYELMFSHLPEVGGTFITACVFFAILLREPGLKGAGVLTLINLASIVAVIHAAVDTSNTMALPMAIGYFMALAWRFLCFLIDHFMISRLNFVQRGHRALKDEMLINGLFLITAALTIMASNEGSIVMILLLAYRHHPKAVLLVLPALVPHFMKLTGFPLFTVDALTFSDLKFHPAFYAACIYLWGLLSNKHMSQVTMRMLIYGVTPAVLYMLTVPLELYSGYTLLVLTAARFVPFAARFTMGVPPVLEVPGYPPDQPNAGGQKKKQRTSPAYEMRQRKR